MAFWTNQSGRLLDQAVIGSAGALLGALVTFAGPFLIFRPNRVQSGVSAEALEVFGAAGWVLLSAWLLTGALSLLPLRIPVAAGPAALVRGLLAAATLPVSLFMASKVAEGFAAEAGHLARTSLGAAFWLSVLAAYCVLFSSVSGLSSRAMRAVVSLLAPVAVVTLVATGALNQLSVMAEYANIRSTFWEHFWQHVAYTLGASGVALVFGVALGVWAAKRTFAESAIFGVLGVAQVMPALAFVGLLIVPMGWLRDTLPFARELGVAGIGWAPVFAVLLLYALFPITRNTFSAIRTLDAGVLDAARGMGMGAMQRVFSVELPLAAPVVLAGVRIALVQTAAGAIIAALVGGGGLGRIVFYGVEQTAEDLVLLGVIPIVGLGLLLDVVMRFVGDALERAGGLQVTETGGVRA